MLFSGPKLNEENKIQLTSLHKNLEFCGRLQEENYSLHDESFLGCSKERSSLIFFNNLQRL